jgi:UDP-glucose:(heptosyl)LPS alpha-1,3-glucosyltransferase
MRHYKLPANDIEVIYNGVDTDAFTPRARLQYRDTVRAKYRITSDEVLLLFVGSGFKRKGLKYVINAFPLIKDKNIKLLVVGKGKVREYQKLAKDNGITDKIIFAGVHKNIQEIYAAGDIFVFPSEYDAFGTACLEAMASGLPVVVSKTSGVSEIIMQGKEGFVINHPINAKEMVNYIDALLDKEKRNEMGSAARRKSEMYSFESNVEKTLQVYRRTLNVNK